MADLKNRADAMVDPDADDAPDERDESRWAEAPESRPGAAVAAPRKAALGSPFALYKPGQGTWVRWLSALGLAVLSLGFIAFLSDQLTRFAFNPETMLIVQSSLWTILLVVMAWAIFQTVGRSPSVVDFMVATEGEMKKVNWSTRKEVFGATRVVIVTVFTMGIILFLVDLFFMFFFSGIGVLRIDVWQMFRGSGVGQ
jgi:preprotein translocase SecE subunit